MTEGEKIAISRVSPHALYEVKKFMTNDEKKLIRGLGFGPILEMGFSEIPSRLGCYVVNQFNHMDSSIHLSTGSIKITRESIHDMLGVPIGGKYIGSLKRPKKSDLTTQFWKEQFTEASVRPSSVLEKIKKKKDIKKEDTKRLFVLNFLVLFTTCMVEGNQLGTCNTRFLSYITSIDEVSKIDWCGYILDRLIEAGRVWSGDGKGTYFCGSLSTLILHYLDSTKCASVCVTRKRPTIREWKTSLIKEREAAELETGFGQGEILEEFHAEEENDEEEGYYMDSETAAPKTKRSRPPKLQPKSPETSVTVNHKNEGVSPSENSEVEGAQVNEVSLPEPRNPEALFGKLVDRMSDDRPPSRWIEGLNSSKSPETSGTLQIMAVNHQNEGVGPSEISVVEGAQVIEVGFPKSRGTKSMETNQEPLKEPNPKVDINVYWRKRRSSAKRRRTISVNAESPAQGLGVDLLEASKEKTAGSTEPRNPEAYVGKLVDTRLDDQPFAGWIEEVHSPSTVNGLGTVTASDTDYENLPFVKNIPLWHTIGSMEAFAKIPQKPHFRPLLEGVKESVREGLAIGMMVTFSTVVDKTYCLRFDNPRRAIEDRLETLVELESNGFDVEVIRDRLTCLLLVKDKQEALEDQSKGVVEKLKEHKIQEKSINEEVDEIDTQIRQLKDDRKGVLLKKEKWSSEINAMKAAEEAIEKEIREVAAKFDGLAAACF